MINDGKGRTTRTETIGMSNDETVERENDGDKTAFLYQQEVNGESNDKSETELDTDSDTYDSSSCDDNDNSNFFDDASNATEPNDKNENDENNANVEYDDEENDDASEYVRKIDYDSAMDRLEKTLSDWSMYRKRTEEKIATEKELANYDIVRSLIPTLDNFELALSHAASNAGNDARTDSIIDGFNAIYRDLMSILERDGLSVIRPETGDEFDMSRHRAIMRNSDSELEKDRIVSVLQLGYEFNGRIIRPASVSVS